jgi:hypothetical protein
LGKTDIFPPKAKAARSNRAGCTKLALKIKELSGILNVKNTIESYGFESPGNVAKAVSHPGRAVAQPALIGGVHPPCSAGEPSQ